MHRLGDLGQFRQDLSQAKFLTRSAAENLKKRRPDAALADAQAALNVWKENPVACYLMGLGWDQKGDPSQARVNYGEALNSRGLLRWQMGDRVDAIQEFDKAVALALDHSEAHYNRGLAAAKSERRIAPSQNSIRLLI